MKKNPQSLSELPANWPERALWILFFLFYTLFFIHFLKYETIVSRNGLSLWYSEQDTSSVKCLCRCCKNSTVVTFSKQQTFYFKYLCTTSSFTLAHIFKRIHLCYSNISGEYFIVVQKQIANFWELALSGCSLIYELQ